MTRVTDAVQRAQDAWQERVAMAESAIPLIGRLYRERNVIPHVHGRKIINRSAIEVLRTAQSEYEISMADGRLVKPVEYQDSRGFVWQAERMIEAAAATDAAARAKARTAFARLKTAWPSPMPPEKPVLEVGQISALISEIELATSRL